MTQNQTGAGKRSSAAAGAAAAAGFAATRGRRSGGRLFRLRLRRAPSLGLFGRRFLQPAVAVIRLADESARFLLHVGRSPPPASTRPVVSTTSGVVDTR